MDIGTLIYHISQHCPDIKDHIPLKEVFTCGLRIRDHYPPSSLPEGRCLHLSRNKGPWQMITGKDGRSGMPGVAHKMGY